MEAQETGIYPRLDDSALLRSWSNIGKFCVYDSSGDYLFKLSQKEYQFLTQCDGMHTLSELYAVNGKIPTKAYLEEFQKLGVLTVISEKKEINGINKAHDSKVFVRNACWLITGSCNLACKHCYMRAPEGYWGRPLDWEKMCRILDEFQKCNVLSIVITGGEPTSRSDFAKLVEEINRRKIHIRGMNTNGTLLLKDNKLKAFENLPYTPDISFSLDGIEFHKQFRGVADTTLILDAIKAAISAGMHVSINTSLTKSNSKNEVPHMYDTIKSLGIDAWKIHYPNRIGRWKDNNKDDTTDHDAISVEEEFATYKCIFDRWISEGKPFHLSMGNIFRDGKCSVYNEQNEEVDMYDPSTYACDYYRDEVVVMPDGRLLGCNGLMEIPGYEYTGNILLDGLEGTWNGAAMRKFKDITVEDLLDVKGNEACRECPLLPDCGTGCRIAAYAETGNLLSRDPHMCEIMLKHYSYFQEEDRRPAGSRPLPTQEVLMKQFERTFKK